MKPLTSISIIVLATFLFSTFGASQPSQSSSEGRAIVEPLEPFIPEAMAPEFIGGIAGLAPASTGWVVLDAGNHRLVQLNQQGQALATYGQRGRGPGEFVQPDQVRTRNLDAVPFDSPPAETWVYDRGTRRILRFRAEAETQQITLSSHADSFCLQGNRLYVATGPATEGLIDMYNFEGELLDEGIGPIDTVMVDGYQGPVSSALGAENSVQLECMDDETFLAVYENRPLVRKIDRTGNILQEWTLRGGILDVVAERRDDMISRNLERSERQGYPTVPIAWNTTLLDDGSALIALPSAQFHRIDPSTGEQSWYVYQDVQNMDSDSSFLNLWHVTPSGQDGHLLAADPQEAMLYRVTLKDE